MKTIRLTMAQALLKFLDNQYVCVDGKEHKFVKGVMGIMFTPNGHWSSYPPHKHDRDDLPRESYLEETYYHKIYPSTGFAVQRVYTDDRSLDETMIVKDGDAVLVPKGYHPVSAPPGYDLYYLNVMAGPKRTWKFHNDPDHEWLMAPQK